VVESTFPDKAFYKSLIGYFTPRLIVPTQRDVFAGLLKDIARFTLPGQTDSKSLLYWFLFNVFRLDNLDSRDTICDGENDKGIDGLWVDEDSEEIFLFQAKYTNDKSKTLGDNDLKGFVGSAQWFANTDNLKELMTGMANPELKALVTRLDLPKSLEAKYEVKLIFVTTRMLDYNSKEYLKAIGNTDIKLEVWHQPLLVAQYENLQRKTRVLGKHTFNTTLAGFDYRPDGKIWGHVRPVRASDIAEMNGIADRSLFSLNVRFGLGRTRVNRDLERALGETSKHKQFILFHNGVTVICRKLAVEKKSVTIEDYSIVNGCQSAIAFFQNKPHLSDELQVIVKFIEVGSDDALAEDITYRSNNQNGINLRDLRSNDRVQISLQKQFQKKFGNKVSYAIKAGDEGSGSVVITNDRAGQWLMALYVGEPYNAHQKYRIFGSEYERVFGRDVSAEQIFLAYLASQAIEGVINKIDDPLIQEYQLTKLILLGIAGAILRKDDAGKMLLDSPQQLLPANESEVSNALQTFAALLIPDLNYYIGEKKQGTGYYDYKSAFKSADEYASLLQEMQRSYAKAVVKHPEESFDKILGERLEPTS
jgi:hypothetical protein